MSVRFFYERDSMAIEILICCLCQPVRVGVKAPLHGDDACIQFHGVRPHRQVHRHLVLVGGSGPCDAVGLSA